MSTGLLKINSPRLPARRRRAEILLRLPALREAGRVIFPDIGPMSDDEFLDLVRRALKRGYRVRAKDLPPGQVAVPLIKTDKSVSLIVSTEFRKQVKELRKKLR